MILNIAFKGLHMSICFVISYSKGLVSFRRTLRSTYFVLYTCHYTHTLRSFVQSLEHTDYKLCKPLLDVKGSLAEFPHSCLQGRV